MPAVVTGKNDGPIRQVGERGTQDRYGVDMITLREKIPTALFPAYLRSKYSVHPRFTAMAVSRADWERIMGGSFYDVTYTYEGFLLSLPEPVYSLDTSLAEEPIELHPDFDTIAGSPSSPANGAIFIDPDTGKITTDNTRGVFREFAAVVGGVANLKAGVEAYLSPGARWVENSFSTTRPGDLGSLGEIDSPSGSEPSFGSRNWLYDGASYTRRGGIYQIQKSWLLSGRNGWDPDIY
jgi:hypothetical protein